MEKNMFQFDSFDPLDELEIQYYDVTLLQDSTLGKKGDKIETLLLNFWEGKWVVYDTVDGEDSLERSGKIEVTFK